MMSIQPECLQKGYGIALSNPTFELWLLMHVADLSEFSDDELFENAYQTQAKNRRFLDKTLSELLGGYNKKAGRFPTTILSDGNLQRALEQQNKMDTSFETLLDQLGTNVGDILIALLDGVEE
ncbi:MAG: hypothetical protein CMK03_14240 [Ponticaulis sp.]|nr:hypothetical protein [Ponticaulis sp.]